MAVSMTQITNDSSIGGYYGLDMPFYELELGKEVIKTNSARSAIKLVLNSVGASKLWVPKYICEAVVEAVTEVGVAIEFYDIDRNFEIQHTIELKENEYVFVVDYYGVCGEAVIRNINRFGRDKTIVDFSQSYFSSPADTLATIYSPRKFLGLPDGGFLYSKNERITEPNERDSTSKFRLSHLISRLTDPPEFAYQKYIAAEKMISKLPIQKMSCLTERLINSVDHKRVKSIRRRNARYLHERLRNFNELNIDITNVAPLCYPFLPNKKTKSRVQLIEERVFLPSYWTEVLGRVSKDSFEWRLVANGLFLPCDQRYNTKDLDRLINLLMIE